MLVTVNRNSMELSDNSSVQELVDRLLGDRQKGIAVAIGDTIIPRARWAEVCLKEGDKVMLITATQGG